MRMHIVIKYLFEGVHSWPACPFDEVDFLRSPHRHTFFVTAEKVVSHDDRDVEIIMLKREMQAFSQSKTDYGTQSCEGMARELLNRFNLTSCEVLEDNENGAKIYK